MKVLHRIDGGSHRATPHWTRHTLKRAWGPETLCGQQVSRFDWIRDDGDGTTQGAIRDCKRCATEVLESSDG
jgi:hypothetical protein